MIAELPHLRDNPMTQTSSTVSCKHDMIPRMSQMFIHVCFNKTTPTIHEMRQKVAAEGGTSAST